MRRVIGAFAMRIGRKIGPAVNLGMALVALLLLAMNLVAAEVYLTQGHPLVELAMR